MDEWMELTQALFQVQNGLYFVFHVACAVAIGVKFRASLPAAALGVASFALMVVVTTAFVGLPHILGPDWPKVMGFVGFGGVLASALLLAALVLAPTRPSYPEPGAG